MKISTFSLLAVIGIAQVDAAAWINEFHYDNSGTDSGEFVEVAYAPGVDVSSLSLVFYNGNGGSSYDTESVPAGSDCGGAMCSVINMPTNGIQNGGPDGIALVNAGDVVEFISYEGSFVAANGVAAGMTSRDIGERETSSTPTGYSLQRTGYGCSAADFTQWLSPRAETKAAANSGQTFTCGPPPSPWINEFHYDNSGTDSGEFVEVAYVPAIDITSYSLVFYNGNGGSSYRTAFVPNGTPCGGAMCAVIELPTNGIQNGAPDGIALIDGEGEVVEFISYEGSFTAANGAAAGIRSADIGVRETSSTPVGFSLQRTGVGCSADDFTWSQPAQNTKRSVNNGQTLCDGVSSGPGPTPTPPGPTPTPPTPTPPAPAPAPGGQVQGTCPSAGPAGNIKAMAYNILAGGTGSSAWKDIVKIENPDIIVFTEVGNWDDNNDSLLVQNLNEFNNYFSQSPAYCGSTVQGIGFANSANAIMSRYPIVGTWQLTDAILSSDSAHDLMVWKLDMGSKFVYVVGIHLKCCGGSTNDNRRNNTMRNLIDWIDANTNSNDGVMLMGDFNAVSPSDTDPSYPGYNANFEPSQGSSLNDGPLRMLLDSTNVDASTKHTFKDAFRVANPFCGSDPDCCADTQCGSVSAPGPSSCVERGFTYVGSNDFDSRIDFIIVNQNVNVAGPAEAGGGMSGSICTASDHLPVDVILSF